MTTADVIALISALAAVAGVTVAVVQYRNQQRQERTTRERLAEQAERLRTAAMGLHTGVEMADMLVQRTKDADAGRVELANMARMLRGTLTVVTRQVHEEVRQVDPANGSGLCRDFRLGKDDGDSGTLPTPGSPHNSATPPAATIQSPVAARRLDPAFDSDADRPPDGWEFRSGTREG